jgi:hypothetical protein
MTTLLNDTAGRLVKGEIANLPVSIGLLLLYLNDARCFGDKNIGWDAILPAFESATALVPEFGQMRRSWNPRRAAAGCDMPARLADAGRIIVIRRPRPPISGMSS